MDHSAEEPRPKGSAGMFILLGMTLGPAFVVGEVLGAGGAAIIGGFVAMFSLISTMGGSLRANIRLFTIVGPLVAVASVAPRAAAEWSSGAGIVLATLVVLVAGLLPLRSRRYDATGLGLGMGALLGYAVPIGEASSAELVAAAVTGLVVAFALLLLTGRRDPSGPTRASVADLFDGDGHDFAAAFEAWSVNRAPRWLGTAMVAAGRYRVAQRVASRLPDPNGSISTSLAAAEARASVLAADIRAPEPANGPQGDLGGRATDEPSPVSVAQSDEPALRVMHEALDRAQAASDERDTSSATVPDDLRSRVSAMAVRAAVGEGAVQLRHAVRSTVAVLIVLLISLTLERGDPLLPTLLLTTFGIVQASWQATLSRARDRFAGIVVGGVLVLLILLILPASLLFPISMLGLAVGMWFITARPSVGVAGLLVMSVGLNSELRSLDPVDVGVEYVLLTLAALVVATAVGFTVVPSWRPQPVLIRARRAVARTATALRALSGDRSTSTSALRLRAVSEARAANEQLVADHERLTAEQVVELGELREALSELVVSAIFVASTEPEAARGLLAAADVLDSNEEHVPKTHSRAFDGPALLADDVRTGMRNLTALERS